jgi:hypothetical protein
LVFFFYFFVSLANSGMTMSSLKFKSIKPSRLK